MLSMKTQEDGPALLHFALRDTGIGIPYQYVSQLFESFSQVDGSISRRFGGTGLGLAISKQLVEEMGGNIWVESTQGIGSTFHFTIEARPALADSGPMLSEDSTELTGLHLLVVDHDDENCRIVSACANRRGLELTEASSGGEVQRLVRQGLAFDFAILNMQMPKTDGLQLAKRMVDCNSAPPLISLNSARQAPTAGPDLFKAHLTMPISPSSLISVLLQVVKEQVLPSAAQNPSPVAPANLGRILVVEDNAINQRLTQMYLQDLGYGSDVAADGVEALQALHRVKYGVILMDLRMPRMDGMEATEHIMAQWSPEDQP